MPVSYAAAVAKKIGRHRTKAHKSAAASTVSIDVHKYIKDSLSTKLSTAFSIQP